MSLVFDEQNRCAICSSLFCFLFFSHRSGRDERGGIARQRQINIKSRPVARLACHIDETPVVGDDAINYRQPKAAALSLGFGREERLKNAILDGFVETMPGIGHRYPYVLFLPRFLKAPSQFTATGGSGLQQ